QFHFTLKFLSEFVDSLVDPIKAALEKLSLSFPPFAVEWGHWGSFPDSRQARSLWLGLGTGKEEMAVLSEWVNEALRPVGFPPSDKPFVPHLTLARFSKAVTVSREFDRIQSPRLAPLRVDSFHLMQSELSVGGAKHQTLAVFPLRGILAP